MKKIETLDTTQGQYGTVVGLARKVNELIQVLNDLAAEAESDSEEGGEESKNREETNASAILKETNDTKETNHGQGDEIVVAPI